MRDYFTCARIQPSVGQLTRADGVQVTLYQSPNLRVTTARGSVWEVIVLSGPGR